MSVLVRRLHDELSVSVLDRSGGPELRVVTTV